MERYLERIIAKVVKGGTYITTEGIVQASVSVSCFERARPQAIIDREVLPHFRDIQTKAQIHALYSDPLADTLMERRPVPGTPPARFGMECDALAIQEDGHLLAIEIKPGNVSTLAWVAAQATMYARVLQHWVDRDANWRSVIQGMFSQRKALGLLPQECSLPELQPRVLPAVAFQRIANPVYVARMFKVQDALLAEGIGDPELRFFQVAPSGRLDEYPRPT